MKTIINTLLLLVGLNAFGAAAGHKISDYTNKVTLASNYLFVVQEPGTTNNYNVSWGQLTNAQRNAANLTNTLTPAQVTNAAAYQAQIATNGLSGGSQTPWTGAINGAGFNLTNAGGITVTGAVLSTTGVFTGNGSGLTNIGGVKVYRALLTQSSTSAPSAAVLQNSIGAIVWSRNAAGDYYGTLTSAFVNNKTFCLATGNNSQRAVLVFSRISDNIVELISINASTGSVEDSDLTQASVEILEYP